MSLSKVFQAIAGFFGAEKNPASKFTKSELKAIQKILDEKRVDLKLEHQMSWPPGHLKNIGFVVSEGTGIMTIYHAQGNLMKAFEEVTGRPLGKNQLKTYKPLPPEAMMYPML